MMVINVTDTSKSALSGYTSIKVTISIYRNVLVESARIARGKVTALSELKSSNFDAVVFPGGFGAAKNLYVFSWSCLQSVSSRNVAGPKLSV